MPLVRTVANEADNHHSRPGIAQFSSVYIHYTFIKEAGMPKLTRWGNSVGGLRLPKAILEAARLRVGDELSCRLLDSGAILLTPTTGSLRLDNDITAHKSSSAPNKW